MKMKLTKDKDMDKLMNKDKKGWKMPGLLILEVVLILLGMLGACIASDSSCLVVASILCILFNLYVGITNSPENIDDRFRRWLFGRE